MRGKNVVIEIRPDRIDLAIVRGGDVASSSCTRIPVELASEGHAWCADVIGCSQTLREAVIRLGVRGAKATVVFTSPTLAVDLVSMPVKSLPHALHAARLSCRDAVPYGMDESVSDAAPLARDRRAGAVPEAASGRAGASERRRHLIAAVEHEDAAHAIAELVDAAGLRLDAICPMSAALIAHTTQEAMNHTGDGKRSESRGPGGILHIGEQLAFFAAAEPGCLLFGRQVRFGIDSLVRSLLQEIRPSEGQPPIRIDAPKAAMTLLAHGIPDRDRIVDEANGLRGAHIMPLMQPVLQRFVVELRQSLRFGLTEKQRENFVIRLAGPGANIAGLASLLENELGVRVVSPDRRCAFNPTSAGSPGSDLQLAVRTFPRGTIVSLLPAPIALQRTIASYRKWAWSGAAAALLMIGFEAFHLDAAVVEARRTVQSIEMQAAAQQSLDEARDRLLEFRSAFQTLRIRIANHMHGAEGPSALLREVASTRTREISLQSLVIAHSPRETTATLVGTAASAPNDEPTSRYFNALRESPLIEKVDLRNVHRSEARGRTGDHFEVRLHSILWPWSRMGGELTAEPGDLVAVPDSNAEERQP